MKNFNINMILTIFVIVIFVVILFIDNESLNSLFINYNNNLVIDEVTILDVNYDEVIYDNNKVIMINNGESVNNNSGVVSNVANVSGGNKTAFSDYWAWPTEANYTITTYYGYRWGGMHSAIDIAGCGYGSNIYAANNGVVTTVKGGCVVGNLSCNGRGGNYVIIKHNYNNYYTVYMHLKDINVKVGDVVSRGQVIGTMGNTGNVIPVPTARSPYAGTHLHFGLYIGQPYAGGYAVNPMRLY